MARLYSVLLMNGLDGHNQFLVLKSFIICLPDLLCFLLLFLPSSVLSSHTPRTTVYFIIIFYFHVLHLDLNRAGILKWGWLYYLFAVPGFDRIFSHFNF